MEYILLLCSQVRFMIMPSEDGNDEHVTMMSMIINETKSLWTIQRNCNRQPFTDTKNLHTEIILTKKTKKNLNNFQHSYQISVYHTNSTVRLD